MSGSNGAVIALFFLAVLNGIAFNVLYRKFEFDLLIIVFVLVVANILVVFIVSVFCKLAKVINLCLQEANIDSIKSMIKRLKENPADENAQNRLKNYLENNPQKIIIIVELTTAYCKTSKIEKALNLLQIYYDKTENPKIEKIREKLLSLDELYLRYCKGSYPQTV